MSAPAAPSGAASFDARRGVPRTHAETAGHPTFRFPFSMQGLSNTCLACGAPALSSVIDAALDRRYVNRSWLACARIFWPASALDFAHEATELRARVFILQFQPSYACPML